MGNNKQPSNMNRSFILFILNPIFLGIAADPNDPGLVVQVSVKHVPKHDKKTGSDIYFQVKNSSSSVFSPSYVHKSNVFKNVDYTEENYEQDHEYTPSDKEWVFEN